MTVHKLSAGKGYTYLTRQVASADEPRAGQALAEYYTARGNPPGHWAGGGAESLGVAGGEVSEAQMRALFGEGAHPDRDAMLAAGASESDTMLGRPYFSYQRASDEQVAAAIERFATVNGRSPTTTERNQIAAEQARRGRRGVAGYDLVFTPVKSASVLWGLGGPEVRAAVEDAHHDAVDQTITWLEEHAAFTRTGANGVAQVDTTGLVCAVFDHRESRASDPDLHTHVAVANKVQATDGNWRALDGRSLHALGVAASERYNTRFEDALAARLGVEFTKRPGSARGKRPVREIDGVPPELITHFSKRRAAIEDAYTDLAAEYRRAHGHDPDRPTQLKLAQQATLATRDQKPLGRTLAEQVTDWTHQAQETLGADVVPVMLTESLHRASVSGSVLDEARVDVVARDVIAVVSQQRSTWTRWNLYAETERALRPHRFDSVDAREAATEAVVARATSPDRSIRISEPELVTEPQALRRASDGMSVYLPHGAERYTTSQVLLAEESLVTAARTGTDTVVDPLVASAALTLFEQSQKVRLDSGQRELVERFATDPARLVLGIGPAGAGKTTAMRALAAAWETSRTGRVIPLATSSKAAQVLGGELDTRAENLHKFLYEISREHGPEDDWFRLRRGDVVLVDEAGMAGTRQLATLTKHAADAGAVVRLLGDPAQLAAVEAGGALRLIEHDVGAVHLDHLHRFCDPDEAQATLKLRDGDPAGLDFYTSRDRVRAGSRDAMAEAAYTAWATDMQTGKTSVLVAATTEDVAALNRRARTERVAAGQVTADGVELHDGTRAGVGDWVITRANRRGLMCHRGRDWVKNGDVWTVTRHHRDGSLSLRHRDHYGRARVPAQYVADHVELGYAATAHRVQGLTCDTAHPVITPEMTREGLYVAATRGRERTTLYVATEELLEATSDHEPAPPRDAVDVLAGVLKRTGGENSATGTIRDTHQAAESLPTLIGRYDHARDVAARHSLQVAAGQFSDTVAARLTGEPGSRWLARVLAEAAGHGANPTDVLRNAVELDDTTNARHLPQVIAARIADHPHTLGIPTSEPEGKPLPWLDPPRVGHPQWDTYLTARADLIKSRTKVLGSPVAVYREAYDFTHLRPGDLGPEPPADTRQHHAWTTTRAALRAEAAVAEAQRRQHTRAATARTHETRPLPPAYRYGPGRGRDGPGLTP